MRRKDPMLTRTACAETCSLLPQLALANHGPNLCVSHSSHLFLRLGFSVHGGANYWESSLSIRTAWAEKCSLGPQLALANHYPTLYLSHPDRVFLWLRFSLDGGANY